MESNVCHILTNGEPLYDAYTTYLPHVPTFPLTIIYMAHVWCHSSSQNVGACVLFLSSNWESETFFKIGLLYTEQEKYSYKPILKEKIHVLMQVFPLDTESHSCFTWVLMTGPKANHNPSIPRCTHCCDLQITANQISFHIFQEKSRGLHRRLLMVNHRRPFSDFYWGEGALVHRLHPWH